MNKVSLQVKVLRFFLIIVFVYGNVFSTEAPETVPTEHVADSILLPIQSIVPDNSDVNLLLKTLYASIKKINTLNYQTSKEFVIPIPETNQELVFRWGFGGSGNIFTPLSAITSRLQTSQHLHNAEDATSSFLAGLGKAFLQNELTKAGQKIALEQWLTPKTLNPYVLFSIKFMLLIKDALKAGKEESNIQYIYSELVRLLFRLSLTKTFDQEQSQPTLISTHIPENIALWANTYFPGILHFTDEVWEQLHGNRSKLEIKQIKTISCFVFKDKELAQETFQNFKTYDNQGESLEQAIHSFITQHRGQAIRFEDFRKIHNSNKKPTTLSLINRLVGFKNLNNTALDQDQEIPEEVKAALSSNTKTQPLILTATATQEFWLVAVSENFGIIDTVKAIILSFTQALHNYVNLKKEYLTSHQDEARAYSKKLECQEQENVALQAFLKSQDGKQAIKRLTSAIQVLQNTTPTKESTNEKLHQKECLETELTTLQEQQITLEADLADWLVLKKIKGKKDVITFDARINEIKQKIASIADQIKQKQNELIMLTLELGSEPETLQIIQTEKDQKNLDRLLALQAEQENNGQEASEELMNAISLLKSKLNISPKTTQGKMIDIDALVAKRQQIVDILNAECAIIKKQLEEKRRTIQSIQDPESRMIEELLFNPLQLGYEIYIKRLLREANDILETNQKVKTLKTYKKALKKLNFSSLTPQDQDKIQKLEAEVGYLFTRTHDEDIVDKILGKNNDFKEFITDLNGEQTSFKKIKMQLIQDITEIVQRSSHIQSNPIMYRYLIQRFFPEFLPFLNKALEANDPLIVTASQPSPQMMTTGADNRDDKEAASNPNQPTVLPTALAA